MGWGFRGSSHCGAWGWCSKRPGDRGQCRGTTTEHRSSPWAPHQPKLACNSGARTFCSTRKRCNSNDAISTFDIRAGELHATFLRKQHEVPQRPHAEDNSSPADPPQPRQPPQARGHYTRSGALHPIRGTAPEQKRCIANGSGAAPQYTRTNAELTGPIYSPPQPARARRAD